MTYPDSPQDPPSTSPDIDLSNIPPPVFPEPRPTFRLPVKKILLWSGIALAGAGLLYGINSMASQKNKAVAQSLKKKEQERRIKQQRERERLHQVQNESIQNARLSPSGHMVASLIDEHLEWWNTETGELIPVQPHDDVKSLFHNPTSCRFSLDGKCLMIVAYKKIVILDTKTGRLVGRPMEPEATIDAACFTPNSRYVVTSRNPLEGMRADEPCKIQIWETETATNSASPCHTIPPRFI